MNRFLLKGLASVYTGRDVWNCLVVMMTKRITIAVSAVAVNPTTAAVKPGATVIVCHCHSGGCDR